MYKRLLIDKLNADLFKGKVIILVGARQVGKTTLIRALQEELSNQYKTLFLNLDNPTDKVMLENKDFEALDSLFRDISVIFIDEAQTLENVGLTLKLLVDNYGASKQIVATGSSSLNLLDHTSEPLTGRKFVHYMYPLSLKEVYKDVLSLKKGFQLDMIFGMYPEIHTLYSKDEKTRWLRELSTSYLYKDILEFLSLFGIVKNVEK